MLEICHLCKSFSGRVALNDICFSAKRGEIVGLVGRNGAGKSTLMRLIAGCLTPNDGEIRLTEAATIGYLPEGAPLYGELTTHAVLKFVLGAHGFSKTTMQQRIHDVLHMLELEDVADQVLETLSKGYQRRSALGMALAPNPELLILDEPFDGFDPVQKHNAAALLKDLSADKLILISTHSLSDAQRLCTRLIVLEAGLLCADATPEMLLKQAGKGTLDDTFRALVAGAGAT